MSNTCTGLTLTPAVTEHAILDAVAAEIAVLDHNGIILAVNAAWRKFAIVNGLEPGVQAPCTDVGTNYFGVCGAIPDAPAEDELEASLGIRSVIAGRLLSFSLEYPCDSPQEKRWFRMTCLPFGPKDHSGVVITHTDISDLKLAEIGLSIAATAFESQEGIFVTDSQKIILRVNMAFTEITGYTREEAVGQTPNIFNSGYHNAAFYEAMGESLKRNGSWRGEIWNKHKSGEVFPEWLSITAVKDRAGVATHFVASFADITERKASENEIRNLAFYDPLTELPNRRLLIDRLAQAMTTSVRTQKYCALLFIDLDNFKKLNDTRGHEVGDLLLKQVAMRLKLCVRACDTVARMGGDEFVVVLTRLSTNEASAATDIAKLSEKILDTLNQIYQIGHVAHHSTASIGATLFKGQQLSIDDLMKQADLSMYKAKDAGRNSYCFFHASMEVAVNERAMLEEDLRKALQEKQFLLYYQAQVANKTQLTGAEVLLRWQHPERGMVAPADFIPLAEETGLILPLGLWVLKTACTQLARWADQAHMAHLTLSVNVSVHQFKQADFVDLVLTTLKETGANPARLKLELTESILVENAPEIIRKMKELKVQGVCFSLDDFGTGYSSLSYLKSMPLDQLKIDQSFVRNILSDPNDAAIAQTVVALANSLGLGVIAEGVETQSQRDFLARLGCHAYQGHFFSRPLPIESFEAFVQEA